MEMNLSEQKIFLCFLPDANVSTKEYTSEVKATPYFYLLE